MSDIDIDAIIDAIPDSVFPPALKALIGCGMKISKGKANPIVLRRMFIKWLLAHE